MGNKHTAAVVPAVFRIQFRIPLLDVLVLPKIKHSTVVEAYSFLH